MSNLRATIEDLSSRFAANLIEALRGASIDEILSLSSGGGARRPGRPARAEAPAAAPATRRRGRGGRLPRRSPSDIAGMVDAIADLLAKHPNGLRAEQIRAQLDVEAKELPRPLSDGVKAGRLTKQGQKRATTYFAGSGGGASSGRRGRRAAKKK